MSGLLSAERGGSGDYPAEAGGGIASKLFKGASAPGSSLSAYRTVYARTSDGTAGEKAGYRK